jgi:hypothetical protein
VKQIYSGGTAGPLDGDMVLLLIRDLSSFEAMEVRAMEFFLLTVVLI